MDNADEEQLPSKLESDDGVVHLEYDIHNPPRTPPDIEGSRWTRFVCISDTHSKVFPVPPGDVLLHSGDLTNTGRQNDFRITMDWICSLPHPIKILIAGNHDLTLHQDWYEENWNRWHHSKLDTGHMMEFLTGEKAKNAGVVYLQNQTYEFQTRPDGKIWSVYGSPWSPWFYDWAFNYNSGEEAEALISQVPKTDILLTHGPPHEILDKTIGSGEHVGCEALKARLSTLRPRLHVFGHIHEGHGAMIKQWDPIDNCTIFVNAANLPMGRQVAVGTPPFQPVIVDLLDKP